MWVHDMIHKRQKYCGYYRLGQEKEKEKLMSTLTDLQLGVLGMLAGRALCLPSEQLPQMLASHWEHFKKDTAARKKMLCVHGPLQDRIGQGQQVSMPT